MIASFRTAVVFLLASSLAAQAQSPLVEPPEQAHILLDYAARLDKDAKAARLAGRQRVIAPKLRLPKTANPAEQLINQRSTTSNGIYVDVPKVYDDSLLQQMLASAQSRLASLQGFDQSSLTKAIGTVTGANQQISSVGVSGGVQPPVIQTSYGNITSPFPPPSPGAPAPSTSLPSSPAPSASDVLSEQVQITSEIANLRLLMEGSLSDQIMVGTQETFAKPRVTLGFPVVISPELRYRNAVAVVEVLVQTNNQNDASRNGEPPSITALLPREKTYNVAAISDKSASIGAAFATATAGVAGNFLWGHKQYFIVKDQDTLAVEFEPTDSELAVLSTAQQPIDKQRLRAFAWQFRPVLGRQFVQAGSRQVFVQLAFPGRGITPAVKSFGTVRVRTYWRRVDPKTGVLLWIVPGSLNESTISTSIPNYDMHQKWGAVAAFNPTDLEDLGGGKMLVKLDGRLLPGTYLRIGSNVVQPGTAGPLPSDLKTTRFVAAISDLATLKTFIISRDGTEYPLKIPAGGINQFRVDQKHVSVTPLDDSTTLLQVPITNFITTEDIPPVLLIGGKIFGYSDAPIDRNCNAAAGTCVLSVALPRALLEASPNISVKALMLDEDGMIQSQLAANRTFNIFPQSLVQDKLVLLSYDKDTATYLLYGHDLNQTRVVWPARNVDPQCPPKQSCLLPLSQTNDDGTLKLLKLPVDVVKEGSPVVLQRPAPTDRPFVVAVPALPATDSTASPTGTAGKTQDPKFQERVVVGADEATLVGDKLGNIVAASFGDKQLIIDKKTPGVIKISGLRAAGASATAKTQDIVLVNLAGGQTKVPLDVVTSKVEVLTK